MDPQIWISPEAKEWRQWDRLLQEEARTGTEPFRYPAEETEHTEQDWKCQK
jgi:hypothetical protein